MNKYKWMRFIILHLLFVIGTTTLFADVSGTVFRDIAVKGTVLNTYGTKESNEFGVAGVTVTAYYGGGSATTTTGSDGTWSIATSSDVRVEFSDWPVYFNVSPDSTGNIAVQFVSNGDISVDFALHEPGDYSNTATPDYIVSRQQNGSGQNNTWPSVETVHYTDSLLNEDFYDDANVQGAGPVPTVSATVENIGSAWGKAFQKDKQRLFVSSVLQRHVGFAAGEPSRVSVLDYSAGVDSVTISNISLQGISPSNGGADIDLGSVCRDASCANGNAAKENDYILDDNISTSNIDLDAYAKVGKMSYGDIDFDQTTNTLWLVNLYQKGLISVDASADMSNLDTATKQYAIESMPNVPSCTDGELRPWALTLHQGRGYLGAVCDESDKAGDLATGNSRAYVLSFDLLDPISEGFSIVLDFPLNYTKEKRAWNSWSDNYTDIDISDSWDHHYDQPILGDIEFDDKNIMYIAFINRYAMQSGKDNYSPISETTDANENTTSISDIFRACYRSDGGYDLEGTGICTATNYGNDFLYDRGGDGKADYSAGALALLKGSDQLLHSTIDPSPEGSNAETYWNTTGVNTLSTIDGNVTNWYSVMHTDVHQRDNWISIGYNGKGNSMGDIELLTAPTPIEIGNRVWFDIDRNGIQDPGESGISGVDVELHTSDGTLIATVETDINGYYIFSNDPTKTNTSSAKYNLISLQALGSFIIHIPNVEGGNVQSELVDTILTYEDLGEGSHPNSNDSDAIVSEENANIFVAVSDIAYSGANNHTLDFGFSPDGSSSVLTGHIYEDINGNGTQDGSDANLSGITVTIVDSDSVVHTVTTGSDGNFTLTGISLGDANVTIDTSSTSVLNSSTQTEGTNSTIVNITLGNNIEENNGFQLPEVILTKRSVTEHTPLQAGDLIDYNITLVNNSASNILTDIQIEDIIPAGTSYVGGSGAISYYDKSYEYYIIADNMTRLAGETASYQQSDGNASWASDWMEIGETHRSDRGYIEMVDSSYTENPNAVDDASDQEALELDLGNVNIYIQREVNLTEYIEANLTFNYLKYADEYDPVGEISIEIKKGSDAWVTLETFVMDVKDDTFVPASYNITNYISDSTLIRFKTSVTDGGYDYLYVDDLKIHVKKEILTPVTEAVNIETELANNRYTSYPQYDINVSFQVTVDPSASLTITEISNTVTLNATGMDERNATVIDKMTVLTGHVYNDSNGNGVQDAGENNLENVTVNVTDAAGILYTIVTDANGDYKLIGLSGGDASVDITNPLVQSIQIQGTNPTIVDIAVGNNFEENNGYHVPMVHTITSDTQTEGNGNDLVHTVTMSAATDVNRTYSFSLTDNTTTSGDHGSPIFSDNVIDNGDGTVTVPAGVDSFTISITVTNDTVDENDEFYDIVVGGEAATGTITDNDDATVISVTSDTVEEGIELVHTVTVGEADANKTYSYSIVDNTTDHETDYNKTSITFSDGVVDNGDGTITVPAGVSSFTITVPTVMDGVNEDDEFYDLSVGGVSATGTILDGDNEYDFTDFPYDGNTYHYAVRVAENGPRHNLKLVGNPYLGSVAPDAETDGQPSDEADADEVDNEGEENGVNFLNPMEAGAESDLNVTVAGGCDGTTPCYFSLWIDFNQNGIFDANETVLSDEPVLDGNTTFQYDVPAGTDTGNPIFVLARLTTDTGVGTTGIASDGEVEGYKLEDPSTLPVTIAYIHPELYGNSLQIAFATATEVENIGFNIYVIEDKKWIKVNQELIPGALDSLELQEYQVNINVPNSIKVKKVGIAGVDVNGREDRHGPFKIGHKSGTKTVAEPINWGKIKQQLAQVKKAKKESGKAEKMAAMSEMEVSQSKSNRRVPVDHVINFDIDKDAVYRVTHEELIEAGVNLIKQKAKNIAISFRGEGVARTIANLNKRGRWTDESWMEFEAQAPKERDALYLKANRYQLSMNRKLVVKSDEIEAITRKVMVFEKNQRYSTTSPGDDPFYETYFYAKDVRDGTLDRSFELNEISETEYEITVNLLAVSDVKHHLNISLNGQEVADLRAEGLRVLPVTFTVDANMLSTGSNTISMHALGEGERYDVYRYDKVTVSYDDGKAIASMTPEIILSKKVIQRKINPKNGTNYLIISSSLFMGEMLDHYVSQRSSEGWRIQVVNVEDVYAAYGYGMSTPDAIKAYLKEAEAKGVTHVQLVGAASYDYHDYLGLGSVSFIPSIYASIGDWSRWVPSDTLYVTDDTGLPHMAIGRWPVRTLEGLEAVINKSLAWKSSGQSGKHTALFIADKDDEKSIFASQMESVAQQFENQWETSDITRVYLDDFILEHNDDMSAAVAAARDTIQQVFSEGPSIISYSGHSATSTWSYDGLLKQSDMVSIQNEGNPTLALPLACYTTYADSPKTTSMAHQLLVAGENGAVAVYGATHLSSYYDNKMMISKVVDRLLAGESIGEAVMHSKNELGIQYIPVIINGNLLGDVTLKLK